MTLMHMSDIKNRASIFKNGLIPSTVEHPNHLGYFQSKGLCTEDDKALYTWVDCYRNEKFYKDMVLAKYWIHPRNRLYNDTPLDRYIDFSKIKFEDYLIKRTTILDVYTIELKDEDISENNMVYHVQEPSADKENTLYHMPDIYAHDDKLLYIHKTPQKKIKIVGQFLYSFGDYIDIRYKGNVV